jgi:hypothetical protein
MFLRFTALLFLILFVIKLFDNQTIPFLRASFHKIVDFIIYTFKLWLKSSLYTLHLLLNRTVYIIGLDIVIALVLNFIVIVIAYPTFNLSIWIKLYFQNLFTMYVFSFFMCTYIIGLYNYLKRKTDFNFTFIKHNFRKKVNKQKNNGFYTYDDKTNEYTYHE